MKTILLILLCTAVGFVLLVFGLLAYARWRFARAMRQARRMIMAAAADRAGEGASPAAGSDRMNAGEFFRVLREQQAQVELYTAAFRAVRQQAGLGEREWQRIEDRVLLITDAAEPEQIADAVLESLPPRERAVIEAAAIATNLAGGTIRERFEQWNLAQPPGRRFDRIARIDDPLVADAWLAPAG